MFTVNILARRSALTVGVAIVARQAGGCTQAELPRENDRESRAAAARQHGGQPLDWVILRRLGSWESRDAAETIAQHAVYK